MRGQKPKNRRNSLIYIGLTFVRKHLYPHFRSLCNQVSNLRPVRWIVLTFPNARRTLRLRQILRTQGGVRQPRVAARSCELPPFPAAGSERGCGSPRRRGVADHPGRRNGHRQGAAPDAGIRPRTRKTRGGRPDVGSRGRGENPARPDSDAAANGNAAGHHRFRVQHRPARQPLRLGHRTIHDTRNTVRSAPHRAHARRIVRAHLRTPPPSFSRRCGRQPAENHRRFPGGVTPQPYHGATRPVRGSAAPRLRAYVFPAGRTRTGAHRLIPAASCILPATWSHRTEGGPGTDRKRRLTATGRPRPGTRAGNGIRSGKERRAGCDPTREAAASS